MAIHYTCTPKTIVSTCLHNDMNDELMSVWHVDSQVLDIYTKEMYQMIAECEVNIACILPGSCNQ